jgi:hypothetical protein
MAVFAGSDLRAPHPLLRLHVALLRPRLDRALVAGADPCASDRLALRAGQLIDPRMRARLARSLRRTIERGWQRRGSGVPVSRAAVVEAQPSLRALADELVDAHAPSSRGVALTLLLLTDGTGPLYRPWTPGELRDAVEAARHAL